MPCWSLFRSELAILDYVFTIFSTLTEREKKHNPKTIALLASPNFSIWYVKRTHSLWSESSKAHMFFHDSVP